jgi:hypothetical protein
MANFDQVLARIQSQLETMKKSLLHRKSEYTDAVLPDPTTQPRKQDQTPPNASRKNLPNRPAR